MKITTILSVGAAAAAMAAIAAVAPVRAAEVVPVSYSFDKATDCGSFCYTDAGGVELTDGLLGNEGWHNPPGPWVGWTDPSVNIDFDFGARFTFSSVAVGTTQDNPYDVVLPSLELFSSDDGLTWTPRGTIDTPADTANNRDYLSTEPHDFLTFGGLAFTSRYVRVSAFNEGLVANTYIFIDEVDFQGASAAPEPASWLIMLAGFFGMGLMLRAGRPASSVS